NQRFDPPWRQPSVRHLRKAPARAPPGDDDIAARRQSKTAANRKHLDGGDHRLADEADQAAKIAALLLKAPHRLKIERTDKFQVATRRKAGRCSRQHDRSDTIIAV